MHKNHQCLRKGQLVKTMLSINLTQHGYVRSVISQLNIIVIQYIDHPSNTSAMPKIKPHNPIQG